MSYHISTDIGGTFTDLSIARDGVLVGRFKSPTTPGRLSEGVLTCVGLAADALALAVEDLLADTEVFVHGSTIATNAVLEGKVTKTGVLCTRGTKYTLWRGEGRRNDIFDFTKPPREPLVEPCYCVELEERVNANGEIIVELEDDDVLRAIDALKRAGCEGVAVALLWSVRNSTHERRIEALLKQHWPEAAVSLSSEVQPVLREYTRTSCTVLNVMLKPVVAAYLNELEAALKAKQLSGELLVVSSDGGVQPVGEILQRPVYMLFSGPSTGPAAARQFAHEEGTRDALLIDMGGTSFDVSTVIDGQITVTRDGRINDYPTGIAAVEILTLGAGGGSIARVDSGGLLQVGPESAGAEPGPACYQRGGTRPTVTDAYVALGYVVPEHFLGGRMQLSSAAAVAAITEHVASPLGLDLEAAALGILRVVNERMINGILEMTVRRGIDPRGLTLVTAGGATGVAAIELARELGITRIIVPRETSVLCALGALNADLKWSNVASFPTTVRTFAAAEVNGVLATLRASGEEFLDRLGVEASRRSYELFASARYPLQVTELDVACPDTRISEPDLAAIATTFHDSYRDRYSIAEPENDVELVMWRLVAAGKVEAPRRPSPSAKSADNTIGDTRFFDAVSQTWVQATTADPDRMAVDEIIAGPALLIAVDTTVVVPSGYSARMTTGGYVVIELDH
jgi:N-methylhydantoinase A